ncbi:MAG: hypothetical protein ACXABY_10420 [Candidatus Thorarchaeota archaeon]|jgi:hypothetical protein
MSDKETLLQLIDILKEIREDAKTVAGLQAQVNLMKWAVGGLFTAFWGYILLTILVQ